MAESLEKKLPAEKKPEQKGEKFPEKIKEDHGAPQQNVPAPAANISVAAPAKEFRLPDDEESIIIRNILSENITELYREMSSLKQREFRRKGEEAIIRIKIIMKRARVRANEILELIKNWLRMIPGVSWYFLEQEAKIKTDKILALKRKGQTVEE